MLRNGPSWPHLPLRARSCAARRQLRATDDPPQPRLHLHGRRQDHQPPTTDGHVKAIPGLSRESQKRQGSFEVKAREWRPSAKLCFWPLFGLGTMSDLTPFCAPNGTLTSRYRSTSIYTRPIANLFPKMRISVRYAMSKYFIAARGPRLRIARIAYLSRGNRDHSNHFGATSWTLSATTSQPRGLLSMAKLNIAKSRIRPSTCSFVRIVQTCFGRRGKPSADVVSDGVLPAGYRLCRERLLV
jgi:hypothetical protein